MAKHRRSKGGRPRKAGARYPGGKLIPQRIEPNAKVLDERRQLLCDYANLERASHPLDLMLARKWITERQHRAGVAFGRIHAQAQLGGPRFDQGGPAEVTPSVLGLAQSGLQDWSDVEMAEVFDKVFNHMPRLAGDDRAQNAQGQLNLLCSILFAAERMAVLGVCARAEWPAWLEWRVGRSSMQATNDPARIQAQARKVESWDRERVHLVKGLDRLAGALFTKTQSDRVTSRPEVRSFGEMNAAPAGKVIEEATDYVNTAGELLYTAVRRRRAVG